VRVQRVNDQRPKSTDIGLGEVSRKWGKEWSVVELTSYLYVWDSDSA
jgi:hypothetical protein